MPRLNVLPENRYHRPYSEIQDDELLLAIRKNAQDASECRAELISRGWDPAFLTPNQHRPMFNCGHRKGIVVKASQAYADQVWVRCAQCGQSERQPADGRAL